MNTVKLDIENHIGTLTLDRPEARNAMNGELLDELGEALRQVESNPEVRCVVITGSGPVFCAGGDLKAIGDLDPMGIRRFLNNRIRPILKSIMTMDKPVLSVLNGPAAGAGVGLAMASDLVLAAEEAAFVIAFTKIGAMPDSGSLFLMSQNIGVMKTKEIVMFADPLTARQAAELGLYNKVVPQAELASAAAEWASKLAKGPTLALALAKNALRDAQRQPFDAYMDQEALAMSLLNASYDHHEGIQAFLEKRAPDFQGR
ncbi:MAG: enoyl-CoA hydratase-related protein [Gammaproteobacteria bacterium]|nr:enoyl-CoA hydratase-related protein [Gammaproteobacteria bacterium]